MVPSSSPVPWNSGPLAKLFGPPGFLVLSPSFDEPAHIRNLMTALLPTSHSIGTQAGTSVRIIEEVAGLGAILDDLVNSVALRRSLPAALEAEAQAALGEPRFWRRAVVVPDARGLDKLSALLAGFPLLVRDIHFWVVVLSELTGCELVGVRLARVETMTCPRLHVDGVVLRVLSTLVGAGIEFVGNEGVDRRLLSDCARGLAGEAPGILREGARVQRAATGDVVFLKGEAWPGNQGLGAVHRSPHASRYAPRLVMTLDPL